MTLPIHSVKHIRSKYRKSQIIAAMFAIFTIAACFMVASSGIQITLLNKQQTSLSNNAAAADSKIEKELSQQVGVLKAELAKEQSTTNSLRKRLKELEVRLTAIHKAVAPTAVSPPLEGHSIPVAKPSPTQKPSPPKPKAAPVKTAPPKPKPVAKPVPAPAQQPSSPSPTPKTTPTPSPAPAPIAKPVVKPTPSPAPQTPVAPAPVPAPAATPQPAPVKPAVPDPSQMPVEPPKPEATPPATVVPPTPPAAPVPDGAPTDQPVVEHPLPTEEISPEKTQ